MLAPGTCSHWGYSVFDLTATVKGNWFFPWMSINLALMSKTVHWADTHQSGKNHTWEASSSDEKQQVVLTQRFWAPNHLNTGKQARGNVLLWYSKHTQEGGRPKLQGCEPNGAPDGAQPLYAPDVYSQVPFRSRPRRARLMNCFWYRI